MGLFAAGKHLHLVGIGGAGLSAIARVLLQKGCIVSGSDRNPNSLMDSLSALGAQIYEAHAPENVRGADALLISSALAPDHIEIVAAQAAGIPVYKRADILAELMEGQACVAIAGTHGKTTTSAMCVQALSAHDPSYIVGGVLANTGDNAHLGQGAAFVIEADEYDNMFHGLRPQVAVLTSLEYDHPDFFPSPEAMQASFAHFIGLLPPDGLLIACADDAGARAQADARRAAGLPTLTYAIQHPDADWRATDIVHSANGVQATLCWRGEARASLRLSVPGIHNVLNALAACIVAEAQGVPAQAAAEALAHFQGTGRRFELRADEQGIAIVDDYAHHPTAILVTLAAARLRYPERELWAVWQPHTYSRTRHLWHDYLLAFDAAHHVLVTDIYAAREAFSADVSAARFIAELQHPDAHHTASLADAVAYLQQHLHAPAVVLIMSAGDAPQIGIELLARLRGGQT